jgi:hypothetical protein
MATKPRRQGQFSLILFYLWAMPSFLTNVNAHTMRIKSLMYSSIPVISLKPYTLAGFEPGPPVPKVDAKFFT